MSTQVFRVVIIGHVLAGIGGFGPLLVMPLIARRVAAVGSGAEGQAAVAQSSLWVLRDRWHGGPSALS